MTPKGHGVIRGRRYLLYDSKGLSDLGGKFDLVYDPQKVTGSLEVAVTYFMTQRSRWHLWSVWHSLWPQKVTGSLEVAVTYFMTPKVKVTFVVSLT